MFYGCLADPSLPNPADVYWGHKYSFCLHVIPALLIVYCKIDCSSCRKIAVKCSMKCFACKTEFNMRISMGCQTQKIAEFAS